MNALELRSELKRTIVSYCNEHGVSIESVFVDWGSSGVGNLDCKLRVYIRA